MKNGFARLFVLPSLALAIAGMEAVYAQTPSFDVEHRMMPQSIDMTFDVLLVDIDRDLDRDIIYARDRSVWIRRNDGLGAFEGEGVVLPNASGRQTRSLAIGDVDQDGDIDIVVGSGECPDRILFNESTPIDSTDDLSFREVSLSTPMAASSHGLVVQDLDGDGDLDLFMAQSRYHVYGERNQLLINGGTGNYVNSTNQRLPNLRDISLATAAGDLDGDGDPDIVVGNRGINHVLINDGSADFTIKSDALLPVDQTTQGVALGDVDQDGDLDVFFAEDGRNRLLLNNGSAVFREALEFETFDAKDSTDAVFWDNDKDGDLDLFVTNQNAKCDYYRNDGPDGFVHAPEAILGSVTGHFDAVTVGDVDGDLDKDLIVGGGDVEMYRADQDRLLLADGRGRLLDATRLSDVPTEDGQSIYMKSLVPGDIDGDGDQDLYVGREGKPGVWLNGPGRFLDAPHRLPDGLANLDCGSFGDIDGDGDQDLVLASSDPSTAGLVLENDGNGLFHDTPAGFRSTNQATNKVLIEDLDGDGDQDLLMGNAGDEVLYLNDGRGDFTAQNLSLSLDGMPTTDLDGFDADGDGDCDLLVSSEGAYDRLYENQEDNALVAWSGTLPSYESRVAEAFDADNDGDIDYVGAYSARLLINDGTGDFSARYMYGNGAGVRVATHDVDRDGDRDLFLGSSLLFNRGDGTFTGRQLFALGELHLTPLIGDWDQDEDVDLLFPSMGNEPVLLVTNFESHLTWHNVPGIGKVQQIDLYGPADSNVHLFYGLHPGRTASPFGWIQLNLEYTLFAGTYPLDPDGFGAARFQIPADRSLTGMNVYAQGLSSGLRRMTNAEVLTLSPF